MAKLSRSVAIALLIVIGMLTASPSITAFNPSGITALYGVVPENDTALLLVRHHSSDGSWSLSSSDLRLNCMNHP